LAGSLANRVASGRFAGSLANRDSGPSRNVLPAMAEPVPASVSMQEERKLIGVAPAPVSQGHLRLFGALEDAFPVRFCDRGLDDVSGLAGLLMLPGADGGAASGLPVLRAFASGQERQPGRHAIAFGEGSSLARPLRGVTLIEASAPVPVEEDPEGIEVLATSDGKPAWWRRGDTFFSAHPPPALAEEDALRDHLCVGRFMGLVPMLHFLERVCRDLQWSEPPLRASFVIDDPNVHWPSYGHLDYAEMAAEANRHGYHVGLAMVPLDGWLVNRRAASLIRENGAALSLLMHGNDHLSRELGRLIHARDAERVIAQALRRAAAFQRRSGLPLERVMVPPHEACSRTVLRAMFRLGLEAACMGRRYPWSEREAQPSPPRWPLIKWHPTDMIGGGLPILPRSLITRPWEDLVFRALLRQPLVLFGHHWDFSQGLEPLAQAADFINRLGDVRWGSLGWIAQGCVRTRRAGDRLIVQLHGRRATLELPAGIGFVEVRTPGAWDERSGRWLAYGEDGVAMRHRRGWWTAGPLAVRAQTRLELAVAPDDPIDPATVSSPRTAPWALFRRVLAEGRDRIQPFPGRLRR
jgi:hypothetical protein